MEPYLFLYIFIMIGLIFYKYTHSIHIIRNIFILLTLFSGFRYGVGMDYYNYELIYWSITTSQSIYIPREIGYVYLVDYLSNFGTQQLVFMLFSVITNLCIYEYIIKNSKDVLLSTLIYVCFGPFYLSTFNGIRQVAAISLFLVTISLLRKNKLITYIITNIVSSFLFHQTALIVLPLVLLRRRKLAISIIICTAVIVIIYSPIILNIVAQTVYAIYLQKSSDQNVNMTLFVFGAFSVIITILYRRNNKLSIIDYNINAISLIIVLIVIIGVIDPQYALRIHMYFLFPFIKIIPEVIETFQKESSKRIVKIIIILTAFLYIIRNLYIDGELHGLVPYTMNFKLLK